MKDKLFIWLVSLALAVGLFGVLPAPRTLAATCTSNGSGNWSTLSWSDCTPGSDDDVVIAAGHTVTLDTDVTVRGVTINSEGAFDNGSHTLTVAAGYLTNNGMFNGNTGTYSFAANGGVYGSSATTFTNVAISAGVDFKDGTNPTAVVNGTFTINPGGFVSNDPPVYGSSSTLKYNSGGSYGRSVEWSAASGPGYPANVQISSNTSFDLSANGAAARQMAGNLTIDQGSTFSMGSMNTPADLTVLGDVTINGTLTLSSGTANIYVGGNWTSPTSGAFFNSGSFVYFNGGDNQVISGAPSGSTRRFERIIVQNSSTVTFNNNVDVESGLEVGAGSTFQTNGTANFNQALADPGPLDCDGTCTFNNLTVRNIDASGSTGSIDVNGNFLADNVGGSFKAPGPGVSFTVAGNFTKNITTGTFDANGGTITLDGTGSQSVGGSGSIAFHNLTINNTAGAVLNNNQTVNGTLMLSNGRLALGAYNLTLGPASPAVAGTFGGSKMIVADGSGKVCKQFTTTGSYDFPIGDNTNGADYSPATLNFTSGSFNSAQACINVTNTKHPNMPGSDYLTRYWTVTQSGITGFNCDVAFNYVNGDIIGNEADLSGAKWDTVWTVLNPVDQTNNRFSASVSGFSDFSAGKAGPLAVTLADFHAVQQGDAVLVTWETASELDNRGFNLYRGTSPDGWERQLNATLIPSQSQGSPSGFVYTWLDEADLLAGMTYYYWLQDVDIYGATTLHGPVSVDYGGPTAVTLSDVSASPAAGAGALPTLWIVAGAGAALGAGRLKRRG